MDRKRPDPSTEIQFEYVAVDLPSSLKGVKIIPTCDAHYGNLYFSEKHFNEQIDYILNVPEAYTVLNGDLVECVTRFSKGDIHKKIGTAGDQRDYMIEKLLPIKHKVLAVTQGNHEARIEDVDVSKDIAKALGVYYRAEGAMVKISFGGGNSGHPEKPYVYWGYCTHGYGGARTKSAKAIKAERLSAWLHADFYIMSHDHVVNIAPDVYLIPDPRTHLNKDGFKVGWVKAHRKMLIKAGAFLKWGGYSERLGFPPSDLTNPIIKLDGEGKKRVRVEV